MNKDTVNFPHFLMNIRPLIEKGIYRTIDTLFERNIGKQSFHYFFKEPLTQYMLGGKFFRSSLMLYMYILYIYHDTFHSYENKEKKYPVDKKDSHSISFDFNDSIIDIAISLEFLQAFLLMHDDIIDSDVLRRGKPSFHITAKNYVQNSIGFEHVKEHMLGKVGESLTICLGDMLFSYAIELLVRHIPSNILRLILSHYTTIVTDVGVAQMDDLLWSESTIEPDTHSIQNMYSKKTGIYTFSLPMIMGFLLATHDSDVQNEQQEISTIYTLGMQTGILFQIKDDAIELLYDSNVTGKSEASDVQQRKKTFVRSLLLEHAKKQEREQELIQILQEIQTAQFLQTSVNRLRNFIIDTDFEAVLNVHFMQLQEDIKLQLENLHLSSQAKMQYMHFVEFLAERKQ